MDPTTNVHQKVSRLNNFWTPEVKTWLLRHRYGKPVFVSAQEQSECGALLTSGMALFNEFAADLEYTDKELLLRLGIFKRKLYALGAAFDGRKLVKGKWSGPIKKGSAWAAFGDWWTQSEYKRYDRARARRYQCSELGRVAKRAYDQDLERGKAVRAARQERTNECQKKRDRAKKLANLLVANTLDSCAEYEEKRQIFEKEYGPDKRFPALAEEIEQAAE